MILSVYHNTGLKMNRASNSTSKSFKKFRYSSWNETFWWWISWFWMYLITFGTSAFEYENAPNPACQENLSSTNPFDFIHLVDSCFTSFIKSERACVGRKPIRMWIWSGIPFIWSTLWPWFWMIPVMYPYSLLFQCGLIRPFLCWTAKTVWMWIWV